MDRKELNETLEAHRKWLDGEPGGKRADLRGADLSGRDLSGARLNWNSRDLLCAVLRPCVREGNDLPVLPAKFTEDPRT